MIAIKETINNIINKWNAEIGTDKLTYSDDVLAIFIEIVKANHFIDVDDDADDVIVALEYLNDNVKNREYDFTLDFDDNEYRIIRRDAIELIFENTIKEMVEDCYPEVIEATDHNWIAITIDWKQTAKNALADGYGHTFSTYDGSEYYVEGYHIFRVG